MYSDFAEFCQLLNITFHIILTPLIEKAKLQMKHMIRCLAGDTQETAAKR